MQKQLNEYSLITSKGRKINHSFNQRERILQMLLKGEFVPTAVFRVFAYQYNARILELRRGMHDGHEYDIRSMRDEQGRCGFKLEV
jgi:hypothetical protein